MEFEIVTRKQALSQGLKFYFTGKACKRGHVAHRYVSCADCLVCHKELGTKWYNDNHMKARKSQKTWKEINHSKALSLTRDWKKKNPRKINILVSNRKSQSLKATPSWVDMSLIRQIYINCPDNYQVDHIVPLQSKLVCGLHIPCNLQYLPANTNASKGNRYWPDMW